VTAGSDGGCGDESGDGGDESDGARGGEGSLLPGWPAHWSGVAESVVTTRGPNGRWNVAALGLYAPDHPDRPGSRREWPDRPTPPVTARTWGATRTRRNFRERGEGYVQFTRDPVDFVEAACGVREADEPVLESADGWARATAEELATGESGGTEWVDWALVPVEATAARETVPTVSRAHAAVVEATVAASRLDVPGYDAERLRDRIAFFESVVESAGGRRHRRAWERFEALVDWRNEPF